MKLLFDPDGIYTVAEVADALRVSQVTIIRAIHETNLRAFRVQGQWRLSGHDVNQYLRRLTGQVLSQER